MVALRVLAVVLGLFVAGSALMWLVTGQRRWLDWSLRGVKVGVALGLIFFGVLVIERLR